MDNKVNEKDEAIHDMLIEMTKSRKIQWKSVENKNLGSTYFSKCYMVKIGSWWKKKIFILYYGYLTAGEGNYFLTCNNVQILFEGECHILNEINKITEEKKITNKVVESKERNNFIDSVLSIVKCKKRIVERKSYEK